MGKGKDQELLDAARSGDIKTVSKLLELTIKRHGPLSSFRRSPNINCQDMNGYTALHHACLNGHTSIVHLLLAHDAQLDVRDIRGSTALYLAAWAGHQDIVKMLLIHQSPKGANPNAQTIENETPLHSAAQHGHSSVVEILLHYGADPHIRNNSFQTALDLASQFGRLQVVRILLTGHSDLIAAYRNEKNDNLTLVGYSPSNTATTPTKLMFTHTCLHLASRNGHKKVVETLLAAGVDVNILTHAGSALHEAALCGKKCVVSTLLQAGIDVHATDGNGRTALDILKEYPPHVVYDIVTVINEFCKTTANGHFQTINGNSSNPSPVIAQTQSLPKRLYEKNVQTKTKLMDFISKPRNRHHHYQQHSQSKKSNQNGLSNSLSSLDKYATAPSTTESYLKMRPIMWDKYADSQQQKQTTLPSYKPVYKQAYAGASAFLKTPQRNNNIKKNENIGGGTIPSRSIEYINFCGTNSDVDDEETVKSKQIYDKVIAEGQYRCIDQYVEMSAPSSSEEKPLPSPRLFKTADYANIETLPKPAPRSITPSQTAVTTDDNNNNNEKIFSSRSRSKTHSPTPDYPPPTVLQAEHTIFEYIQQPMTLQLANKRHSLVIQDSTTNDESVMVEQQQRPSRTSSIASDCVEHYIGDAPFAGLFKGSTVNLMMQDDITDGPPSLMGAIRESALRSPSLVRSIPAARRSLLKQRYSTTGEDFSASRVWDEIETIFETIDNEMANVEQLTKSEVNGEINHDQDKSDQKPFISIASTKKTSIYNNNLDGMRQSLHIRNPDDLLLGVPNNTSSAGNWCHSPYTLVYGEIRYKVFYLGSTVIKQLQGTISARKSIQKLKIDEMLTNANDANLLKECNSSTKYLKATNSSSRLEVGLSVSHAGVKFLEQEKSNAICMHDIENINCVCQDAEDLRYFAYITKEQELHYCHVFMVDKVELAKEIILTLGQAFEVAYQMALSKHCISNEDGDDELIVH